VRSETQIELGELKMSKIFALFSVLLLLLTAKVFAQVESAEQAYDRISSAAARSDSNGTNPGISAIKPVSPAKMPETNEEVRKVDLVLDRGAQTRQAQIDSMKKMLQKLQLPIEPNGVDRLLNGGNGGNTEGANRQRDAEKHEIESQLNELLGSNPKPLPYLTDLRMGNIGATYDPILKNAWDIKVIEVIDDSNMLAECSWRDEPQLCWLKGFSTFGLIDGNQIGAIMPPLVEVSGTKRYQSALGGSKTVPLLEPFSLDVLARPIESKQQLSGARMPATRAPTDTTHWRRPIVDAPTQTADSTFDGGGVLTLLAIFGMAVAIGAYFYISNRKRPTLQQSRRNSGRSNP
jgi:hypothetical protein